MIGITSVGVYIPLYRLNRQEISKIWGISSGQGEKAVAGYDEDAVTMAVGAAMDCIKKGKTMPKSLYFASTSAPYTEKQIAAVIAGAIDLDEECHTADFSNSLRAGTSAMKSAIDAVKGGSVENALVVASDCRIGVPKGVFEQTLGDGAVALSIGTGDLIASIEGSYSICSDFTDLWRFHGDAFVRTGETRFLDEAGYIPTMQESISKLMKKYSFEPADFSKAVFYAHDDRAHASMARKIGFANAQIQNPMFSQIGNTGTASTLIMLAAALEEAKPGDRILFANYGDGCDAFIFRVMQKTSQTGTTSIVADQIARKADIDYGRYLCWRDLLPTEAPSRPDRPAASLAARWRERKTISALYGYKCRRCGTPQLHPLGQVVRVCIMCQAKDDFEYYKFSDKTGKLFTYAVDQLQPTRNPPGINGVVDFDGGGRFICELTDCSIDNVRIGMPVEMTFRKLSEYKGIMNYFWKAKPIVQ